MILAALGVGITVWLTRFWDDQPHFTREATRTLRALSPKNAASVPDSARVTYDNASGQMKNSILRDKFVDKMVAMNSALGQFRRIVRVLGEERLSSQAGDLFREDLLVDFAKGQTAVSISFLRKKKGYPWLLLGVEYRIPEKTEMPVVKPTFDDSDVSDKLKRKTAAILKDFSLKKVSPMHVSSAAEFQKFQTEAQLVVRSNAIEAELGPFQRIISIVAAGKNADKTRARLYVLAEYEKKRSTATVEFVDEKGAWKLAYLSVSPDGTTNLPPREQSN